MRKAAWKRLLAASTAALALASVLPAQQRARSIAPGDEILRAARPDECELGRRPPPYQYWHLASELRAQLAIGGSFPEILSRADRLWQGERRVDGLFVPGLNEVLLVQTEPAGGDLQTIPGDLVPCRYLVTENHSTMERGLYGRTETIEPTVNNRLFAVRAGSLLDVFAAEPLGTTNTANGRQYVKVFVESSCLQVDFESSPSRTTYPVVFYLAGEAGQRVAEPIAWCDRDQLAAIAETQRAAAAESGPAAEPPSGPVPDPAAEDYQELTELDELKEIYNSMAGERSLPAVQWIGVHCDRDRTDDRALTFRIELAWGAPEAALPPALSVLAARAFFTPHDCAQPTRIVWWFEPSDSPVQWPPVELKRNLEHHIHSAEVLRDHLRRRPIWENTGGREQEAPRADRNELVAQFNRLSAQRPDVPKVRDARPELLIPPDQPRELRITLELEDASPQSRTEPLVRLCAFLYAVTEQCRDTGLVTCRANGLPELLRAVVPEAERCDGRRLIRRVSPAATEAGIGSRP